MTTLPPSNPEACARICEALRARQHIVVTSHVRPDGDAIGSQLALAAALRAVGRDVRIVNRDPAPAPLNELPGAGTIEIAERLDGPVDAVVVLECGEPGRTGLDGLGPRFLINIDHHTGNTGYGAVNWFDASVAACAEMVYDVIAGLDAPLTPEIASNLYVAILTDTGSFRYSGLTRRTYEMAGRLVEAGADPVALARLVFDSNTLPRLRLFGAVMASMDVDASGRIASLFLDHAVTAATGGSYDDTDGLINLPLTVRAIQVVAFFKQGEPGQFRVSLRSKGDIDVGGVARHFGGGGHRNAAGCTVPGSLDDARRAVMPLVELAVAATDGTPVPRADASASPRG